MNIYFKNSVALICLWLLACAPLTTDNNVVHNEIPFKTSWAKLYCANGKLWDIQANKNSIEVRNLGHLYLKPSRVPLIFSNGQFSLYYRNGQSLITDSRENILAHNCRS